MSIQNEKTVDVYQNVAKNYLKSTKKANALYKENVIKVKKELKYFIKEVFKDLPNSSKILEVGSADGKITKYIQKLGFDVTPSDIADDFIKEIKNNGLNPIKFDLLNDKFDKKYNAIFCWRVFVHFTNEDTFKALSRSYDALENDGLFIFNVIDRKCKTVDSEWVDFPDVYNLGEKRFFNYYSKEELDMIISKTKFEIVEFKNTVGENGIKWLVYVLKK